jgi:hypothetical protein
MRKKVSVYVNKYVIHIFYEIITCRDEKSNKIEQVVKCVK